MRLNIFKKANRVVATKVNLKWKGSMHSIDGVPVRKGVLEITVPFQNRNEESFEFLKEYFMSQKKPAAKIKGVTVSEPFKLISAEPSPPLEVQDGEKAEFRLKIAAPDYAYEGPLNIELVSDTEDIVHVEISRIVMTAGAKRVELKDRPQIMDMVKGQVFKQNVHLFGVVEFGGTVNKIEVAKPFALVATDPKVPFTIDNRTGYLIDMYIQAPQTGYGGPLEITIR